MLWWKTLCLLELWANGVIEGGIGLEIPKYQYHFNLINHVALCFLGHVRKHPYSTNLMCKCNLIYLNYVKNQRLYHNNCMVEQLLVVRTCKISQYQMHYRLKGRAGCEFTNDTTTCILLTVFEVQARRTGVHSTLPIGWGDEILIKYLNSFRTNPLALTCLAHIMVCTQHLFSWIKKN